MFNNQIFQQNTQLSLDLINQTIQLIQNPYLSEKDYSHAISIISHNQTLIQKIINIQSIKDLLLKSLYQQLNLVLQRIGLVKGNKIKLVQGQQLRLNVGQKSTFYFQIVDSDGCQFLNKEEVLLNLIPANKMFKNFSYSKSKIRMGRGKLRNLVVYQPGQRIDFIVSAEGLISCQLNICVN